MLSPGLNIEQFRLRVIRPTLGRLDLWSASAENLLLGTALAESGLFWLRQHPEGPARGVYQIEPATHDDIWKNFLRFREILRQLVEGELAPGPSRLNQLETNLADATTIARLVYRRQRSNLPPPGDADAMARYWKAHYNTPAGAGDPAAFADLFRQYVI